MVNKRKRAEKDNTRSWCSLCKLWIADNRAQREQHELGSKHKAALAQVVKDIAERNSARRKAHPESAPFMKDGEHGNNEGEQYRRTSAAEQMMERVVSAAWSAQHTEMAAVESHNLPQNGVVSVASASDGLPDDSVGRPVGDIANGAAGDVTTATVTDSSVIGSVTDAADDTAKQLTSVQNAPASSEQVDENGFPLPIDAIVGVWTVGEGREAFPSEAAVINNSGGGGTEKGNEEIKAQVFKKRRAASSKRKRRV